MRILPIILVFLCSFTLVNAQTKEELPCIHKTFSIVAHIVIDSFGKSIHSPATIVASVNAMNAYFAPICVSFQVCLIDTIQNYWYEKLDTTRRQWGELKVLYNLKNRINMYFVNDITNPAGLGFADFTGITNVVSSGLGFKTSTDVRTLVHEMGHYFGLSHTFENRVPELVNGTNCLVAGDSICDTPADPVGGAVDANCTFISQQKDANGDFYSPMVGNIMSYYNCDCPNVTKVFTDDQYRKMAKTYILSPGMW
jgi:Pregnancy-associated plasma protein-A